jgi:hypothetical protein
MNLALAAEDALKTVFLSLLALQPAVNTIETILFRARQLSDAPSPGAAGKSGQIISDRAWSTASFWIADRDNSTGHHRYYGRSAYP